MYSFCQTAHFLFCFFNFTQWVKCCTRLRECAKSRYLSLSRSVCVCVSYLCLWMRPENSLHNSIKHPTTEQHFMCVDMLKRKSISYTCKRITFIFINLSREHKHTCVYMSKIRHLLESLFFRLTLLIWDYCYCCYTVSSIKISLIFYTHTHTFICALKFRYDRVCSVHILASSICLHWC